MTWAYLLPRVQHTQLGALLLGVHQHVEHGAQRRRHAEVRGPARLLDPRVKGTFRSVEQKNIEISAKKLLEN